MKVFSETGKQMDACCGSTWLPGARLCAVEACGQLQISHSMSHQFFGGYVIRHTGKLVLLWWGEERETVHSHSKPDLVGSVMNRAKWSFFYNSLEHAIKHQPKVWFLYAF